MLRSFRRTFGILALVGCAVLGCSDGNVARLSGTVTLDGALVEKGTISLAPADGRAPTAEALINGGKYSVTTLPGPKKIVIHGLKQVGTRRYHPEDPSSPMVDVHEETVPARYNTQSELSEQVQAGRQTLDFALKTDSP